MLKPIRRSRREISGILWMIFACAAFSVMALCVKLACLKLPSYEVAFFRSLIGWLVIIIIIYRKRAPFFGKERKALTLRGLTGFAALILYFYTIDRLPLGEAVIINYTAPIFAAILSAIFLRERMTLSLFGMIILGFLGVCLLVGVEFKDWNLTIWLGILSAVFAAGAYVTIRAIKHRESPLTVIFYFTGISTAGSLFFLPLGFRWPDFKDWGLLVFIGIISTFGQLWLTIALRRARTALVMPFSYTTPLLSFIFGIFVLGEYLSFRSYLGGALIVLAGILVTYFETKLRKAQEAVLRPHSKIPVPDSPQNL